MANARQSQTSKQQVELQRLADGLSGSTTTLLSSMVVLGSSLSKAEVVAS
jgi:hypothetical protein